MIDITFQAWLERHKLSDRAAAKILDIHATTVRVYRLGEREIPQRIIDTTIFYDAGKDGLTEEEFYIKVLEDRLNDLVALGYAEFTTREDGVSAVRLTEEGFKHSSAAQETESKT